MSCLMFPRRVTGPALLLIRSWVAVCSEHEGPAPIYSPLPCTASAGDGAVLHWDFTFLRTMGCRFAPSEGLHGSAVDQDEAH